MWTSTPQSGEAVVMFKRRVFISYNNADQDKADFLATRLMAGGDKVFFAPKDIEKGQIFEPVIHKALAEIDVFVVLISQAANESEWVKREIHVAINRYHNGQIKFLIPIVIEEGITLPRELEPFHHYKATTCKLKEWEQLATLISSQIQTKIYNNLSVALLLL